MNQNQLTQAAETIITLAKQIAREHGLGYVGTEHLLLAIVREGTSTAAQVLCELGANEFATQDLVEELIKQRMQETWVMGRLPGTPHFRDVLSKAANEGRGTGNWRIGPEHLLLGLIAEENSTGSRCLAALGITADKVRTAIRQATQPAAS